MAYLGTTLSPNEYYKKYSETYYNPHFAEITKILNNFKELNNKTVIDFGCGSGLVTNVLSKKFNSKFIGIDSSEVMVRRYEKLGFAGIVADFHESLPEADVLIACYSLHLAEKSFLPQIGANAQVAGIKDIFIISPLKKVKTLPCYEIYNEKVHTHEEYGDKTYICHSKLIGENYDYR